MFARTAEDMLPPMTPRMVREMKRRVAAHDFRADVAPDVARPIQATRSGLATVFFLSRFMRRQGMILAAVGALMVGAGVGCATARKSALALGCGVTGVIAGAAGLIQRKTGWAAEQATAQGLLAVARNEPPMWTAQQMQAAEQVAASKTAALIMAYQPPHAGWEDPYLVARRGYYLWKKRYFRRSDTVAERV